MTVRVLRRLPVRALAVLAGLAAFSPIPHASATAAQAASPQAAIPQAPSPQGKWLTEGKDAALAIGDCGGQFCGRIIWLDTSSSRSAGPLLDEKNPDPARQTRRICGLVVLTGLMASGPDSWSGRVYNPKDGRTYQAQITVLSPEALHIRAYLGLPIFGKSQTWTRVESSAANGTEYRCRNS
jgi:uncharacterized protein (DUF2147 family)